MLTATATRTPGGFFRQESLIQVRGLYPNPFSDRLKIYFTLRVDAQVQLRIYNVAGEPIRTLEMAGRAGPNQLEWLGDNQAGQRVASGAYVLRVQAEGLDGSTDDFWERAAVSR